MRNRFLILLTFFSTVSFVSAQLETFDKDPGRLSENRLPLELTRFPDGAPAATLFAPLGVTIFSDSGSIPLVRELIRGVGFIDLEHTLVNSSALASSAGQAITIHSRYPLRRAALELANGGLGTAARITAHTFKGEALGSVEIVFEGRKVFAGIQTAHPDGFSSVSVDYGENPREEHITLLLIDPMERLTFTRYIPLVAAGSFGGTSLTTTISITNLILDSEDKSFRLGNSGEGTLKFLNSDGDPMIVDIEGVSASSFPFSFSRDDGFSREWTVGRSGQPQVGYALVESNLPVIIHALFTTTQDGADFDAGVEATSEQPFSDAPFQLHLDESEDVGIALVNSATQMQPFVVTMFVPLSGSPLSRILELKAGEHRTVFLSELFGPLPGNRFSGTLLIRREDGLGGATTPWVPVVATLLKTRNGVAVASLPLGSTQR